MTPQTLVKAGRYDSPLEEAVKKSSELLIEGQRELRDAINYFKFEEKGEPYLLVISQQKDRKITSEGYNVLLTVTSYSNSRNQQIVNQFEKETGIYLDIEVPEKLKKYFSMMSVQFHTFEINSLRAKEILRGK